MCGLSSWRSLRSSASRDAISSSTVQDARLKTQSGNGNGNGVRDGGLLFFFPWSVVGATAAITVAVDGRASVAATGHDDDEAANEGVTEKDDDDDDGEDGIWE